MRSSKLIFGAATAILGAMFHVGDYTDLATGLKKGEKPRRRIPKLDPTGALNDPPTSKRAKRRARGKERGK